MIHMCPDCNKLIKDFDKIQTSITATYHPLKSSVSYALDKGSIEVIGPLFHAECEDE